MANHNVYKHHNPQSLLSQLIRQMSEFIPVVISPTP